VCSRVYPAKPGLTQPSDTPVINTPMQTMIAAEITGTSRKAGWRLVFAGSGSQFFAYNTIIPMAISTAARPMLNATSRINPAPTWPNEIEASSSTSAEGHGTNPPLAPRAIKLPIVMSPSGTWLWLCGP